MRLPPVSRHPSLAALAFACLLVAACGMPVGGGPVPDNGGNGIGTGGGGNTDGGGPATDAGARDGGRVADGGAYDGGSWDGGAYDGGFFDGGSWDGGVYDGGFSDGGVYDGGFFDGGSWDGGAYDGGFFDGGFSDGGATDGGQSCLTDADCPPNDLCECPPCNADGGVCGTCTIGICVPAHNCGDRDCTVDQVCVITEGGAVMPDGGGAMSYRCDPYPAACSTTATCGCIGNAICGPGSNSDCSGTIPVVTCYVP